uniref:Leucine-rich repeat-containing N-terminal plant-type domain-containing protein n=1 Tax=Manihot esculenta TaxID=3983 RepID=A0A2C9VNR4_MANES
MAAFVTILFLLIAAANLSISSCFQNSNYVGCIEEEKQALLRFKQDLIDPSNRLASWVGHRDCCKWAGVVCNKETGYVSELRLNNPPLNDYSSDVKYKAYEMSKLGGQLNPSLLGLKNLIHLDLSDNNFVGNSIPEFIGSMVSLRYLNLSVSGFQGKVPHQLGNLSNLQYLDLQANRLYVENLQWLSGLSFLEFLDLSIIDLSTTTDWLQLSGKIPRSFGKLCNLVSISLTGVKLGQDISEVVEILSGCASNTLESVYMGRCQLSESLGELPSLKTLYLYGNKLNGSLPTNFGKLAKLEDAVISQNFLEGVVSEVHFANLTRLKAFIAHGNSLKLKVDADWVPPFHVEALALGSWQLGPRFPSWLQSQEHLLNLDISNSGIFDSVPAWFWNLSYQFTVLDLSHNQIYGQIPSIDVFSYSLVIDLSSNKFMGPLPRVSSRVAALDVSNNSLSGSISNFLCGKLNELSGTQVLNLADNHFSDEIPDCWGNWQTLVAIKLANNKFSGKIPGSLGSLSSLQSLSLRNNSLSGELPLSLRNCSNLVSIDFSQNNFAGSIPTWMGKWLPNIKILSLHSNKLHGAIPDELCALNSLQILDLGQNELSGTIPRCINNFQAMITKNDSATTSISYATSSGSYFEDALLVIKGRVVEYSTTLKLVRSMDLSDNLLSGEIPNKQITSLQGLQSLNLSHNLLTGRVPENIGAMRELESLDLSMNQLSGEIPQSISSLTFLSHLNLSYNNLIGKIPSSTQLQSVSASSFVGNKLCGAPLAEICNEDNTTSKIENDGEESKGLEVEWKIVSITIGFVVGFWGVLGPLILNRAWRIEYYQFLDRMWYRIQLLFLAIN